MAKKNKNEVKVEEQQEEQQEVFVLTDCPFGKCGEVVMLPKEHIDQAVKNGMVDVSEAAIAAGKAASGDTAVDEEAIEE